MSDNRSVKDEAFFVQSHQGGFGTYHVSDEDRHLALMEDKPHYSLTETQYYSFWVPAANLHCFNWIWYHPHLDSVTAGTMAWTGIRPETLSCELFNFQSHMRADMFDGHFGRASFDNGFSVYAEEPGKAVRISYSDPERNNRFDIMQTAVSEPMMWPTSNHFEQVMKCRGEVTLRGKTYAVDCLSIRDRSWGEYRMETPLPIPPNHWAVGAADSGNAFTIVGMEDEGQKPMWQGKLKAPTASSLRFGWLIIDGRKLLATSLACSVNHDPNDLMPRSITMEVGDETGAVHLIKGSVVAATPFRPWLNVNCAVCLTEWTWRGRTFTGEMQSVMYTDFFYEFSPHAA